MSDFLHVSAGFSVFRGFIRSHLSVGYDFRLRTEEFSIEGGPQVSHCSKGGANMYG